MKTKIEFVSKALTRNGGDGLCWKVTFWEDGRRIDTVWCGSEARAKEVASGDDDRYDVTHKGSGA